MIWPNARAHRDEEGAILIIALIFMVVFGLTIGALLTQSQLHIKFTTTLSSHEKKIYATDGGVSYGIELLRNKNNLCPAQETTPVPLPPIVINGRSVTVTCQTLLGSTSGALGNAVITTLTTGTSLTLTSGASIRKVVSGPMFVNGTVSWGSDGLTVIGGDFTQNATTATCATPGFAPTVGQPTDNGNTANLAFVTNPPYGYICGPQATPDPAHDPPPMPSAMDPPPLPDVTVGSSTCRIFLPGHYTAAPSLATQPTYNYFASGAYYFDNIGNWQIKQQTIIGGQPTSADAALEALGDSFTDGVTTANSATLTSASAPFRPTDVGHLVSGGSIPADTTVASYSSPTAVTLSAKAAASATGVKFTIGRPPPCATDLGLPGISGTGAEFIMGGSSAMEIDAQGQVELFTRTGDSGTAGISYVAVPSPATGTWSGWRATQTSPSLAILNETTGNQESMAIHGLVYAAQGDITLSATNTVVANTLAGLVARTLTMQASASASNVDVGIQPTLGTPRHTVITASVGSPPERTVTSTAVIDIANNQARDVTIDSWMTG